MNIEQPAGLNLPTNKTDIRKDDNIQDVDNTPSYQQQDSILSIVNTEQYQNIPTIDSNNNYETIDLSQYLE